MTGLSLERRILLGFAASLVMLLAVGAAALWSTSATAESAAAVARAFEVHAVVEGALGRLVDADASAREYLLTGQPALRRSYDSAAARLGGFLEQLRLLALAHADERDQLDSLRLLISRRAVALRAILDRPLAGGGRTPAAAGAAAAAAAAAAEAEAVADQARRLAARMEQQSERLALRRVAVLDRRALMARRSVFGGTALAFALVVAASVLVRRELAERRRAEGAVQENERRLAQLLDALPIGVFVLDAANGSSYANRVAQTILGKGIVVGAAGADLPEIYQAYVSGTDEPYPPDRQPIMVALGGRQPPPAVMDIRRPDRTVPIEVLAAPVVDREGRVVQAVAAFHDITERECARAEIERLNTELSRKLAELTTVNRELEAFSYSVSHDLRAPLRSIDGFSQALLEDYAGRLDAQGKDYLGRVRGATQRLAELIEDLLGLARVTRAELRREPVDLSALARHVAAELHDRESGGGRAVEFVCREGLVAEADPRLLRVVLTNLLGNAWKFTVRQPRPRVEFGRGADGGEPAYFVRDNGAGFDMAWAAKLFGTFQRLHSAAEFPGTGVGLATVQRIVHRHGGRVWAEGAVDRGATFYFTLEPR